MSGICAILRLDGAPAEPEALTSMLGALATRGPDRSGCMADGPAALGHALLATTPEAAVEPMPLRHAGTGCVISADVRLDNRADLIGALGLDPAGRVIGDGELILQAYLKWGMACPEHLLGDFAFVLWDPRHHRLFAGRDKAGMRQLIYHFAPGKLLACATDPDPLLLHPDVPRRINAARVADFLEQLEAIDHTSTFYEGLIRLPPAHALRVERGDLKVWRYWQLTPPPKMSRATAKDNSQALLDVFSQAVEARLRSPTPVGSMLSGGIDSGSVVAVAARLLHQAGAPPLTTFSAVDTDPACPESAGVRSAVDFIPHIDPCIVSPGTPEAFRDAVARLTREEGDPFDGHMAMIRALYVTAQAAGVKVMLDGVAGDTSLPTGDMIGLHLAQGNPRAAWAEARAQERFWSGRLPAVKTFRSAVRRTILPLWVQRARERRWVTAQERRAAETSIVHSELAAAVNMAGRRRANADHIHVGHGCDPRSQALRMLHPYVIVGRERYDRVAGACGIEPRDPFLDVRLLDFVLTLPPEQVHANGWPKLIMRQAMEGMLPESVRWKTGRDHVGWRFAEVCDDTRLDQLNKTVSLDLVRYAAPYTEAARIALHCNTDGVVSPAHLIYLDSWITRFKISSVDGDNHVEQ
jgi:asparagine synthase (glutamine-hydrolysing)